MKFFDFKVVSEVINKHHKYSLIVLVLVGVLFMIGWGSLKSSVSFHVDEIWQYSFSNANGKLTNIVSEDEFGKWLPSSIFHDYITVQPGERFAFANICQAARQDIHPPLSQFALNFVCSLFPNQFSKWFGLAVNILSYSLTICLLYYLTCNLIASRVRALTATALWAFSLGAIDSVMYIRMYCLLTLFSVALMLFSVKYLKGDGAKYLVLAYFALILGGLTDYIFWIFGFYVTLAFILVQWKRNRQKCIAYAAVSFSSFVTTCIIFPTTIMQLVEENSFSNKATETFDVFDKLPLFFDIHYVTQRFLFFASEPILFLPPATSYIMLCLACLGVVLAIGALYLISMYSALLSEGSLKHHGNLPRDPVEVNEMVLGKIGSVLPKGNSLFVENIKKAGKWGAKIFLSYPTAWFVFIAVLPCAYTLAAIFPYFHEWTVRAFFFLFPFISILVAAILFWLYDKMKIPAAVLCLLVAALLVREYVMVRSPFLFRGGYEKLTKKLDDANVIFVLDSLKSAERVANFSISLSKAKSVYIIQGNRGDYRSEILKALDSTDKNSKTMIINTIGGPPDNDAARAVLGDEILITNDKDLVTMLGKNGYHIEVTKKYAQLFQRFNLYELNPI